MKKINYYEIAKQKMQYFNYSEHTINIYAHYIKQFIEAIDVPPSRIDANKFTDYLLAYKFTSNSQQNQVINSLKFLYTKVLNRKYGKVDFKRPRKEKKLPRVIDSKILKAKILAIPNIKHRAILALAYSDGLRVSEILNLKLTDIDSQRMLILIKNAKGRKDRFVPLSKSILDLLRIYFKSYRPEVYLFNGQYGGQYSASSCNAIIKKYIDPNTHMHILRHSCFTHLMEQGTDLRIIQSIAGHTSSKTTEIYTHVSNQFLNQINMPI
jgi:site-specific recombinase XerD